MVLEREMVYARRTTVAVTPETLATLRILKKRTGYQSYRLLSLAVGEFAKNLVIKK